MNRGHLLVCIAYSGEHAEQFKHDLGVHLTRCFGGVTLGQAMGFWASDGDANKRCYEGDIVQEAVIEVRLSVLPHQEERAIMEIRRLALELRERYEGKYRFVHMERMSSRAHHFDAMGLTAP